MTTETINATPVIQEDACACDPGLTLTRRTFVKTSALLGGAAALATQVPAVAKTLTESAQGAPTAQAGGAGVYPLADPNNILYTSCLQCNTGCAIKVKLVDGVISKIDGNPFGPSSFWPYLDYATSPLETGGIDGWICPKGQAGLQSAYDPYRIRRVLKRAGKRVVPASGRASTLPRQSRKLSTAASLPMAPPRPA